MFREHETAGSNPAVLTLLRWNSCGRLLTALAQDTDGTLHPISFQEAIASWAEIVKSPAWLEYRTAVLDESRRAWHESEAAHWEAKNNPFAAAFHLKWLLD